MPVTNQTVGVIGVGNMGSALARAFATAGHRLMVWNRTWAKAAALAAMAEAAASVSELCARSAVVVMCVIDHAVSDSLLHTPDAEAALEGKVLVQLSSGTPGEARMAEAWASEHNIRYISGCIWTYPRGIGTNEAVLLYSGPEDVFEENKGLLLALGGNSRYVGRAIGLAKTIELALVEVFFGSTAAYLHGAALCAAEGYPLEGYFESLRDGINAVGSTVAETVAMVTSGTFSGGNAAMVVNTSCAHHLLRASEEAGISRLLPASLLELFETAVERGYGAADLPALYVAMSGAVATSP